MAIYQNLIQILRSILEQNGAKNLKKKKISKYSKKKFNENKILNNYLKFLKD